MDNVGNRRVTITNRSFKFAAFTVSLVGLLPKTTAGYALGNQLIRSGTSIGANIEEAQDALSRKDFIHSLTISLKEARETEYWLKLIYEANLVEDVKLNQALKEVNELIKILTTIIKNTKGRVNGGMVQG